MFIGMALSFVKHGNHPVQPVIIHLSTELFVFFSYLLRHAALTEIRSEKSVIIVEPQGANLFHLAVIILIITHSAGSEKGYILFVKRGDKVDYFKRTGPSVYPISNKICLRVMLSIPTPYVDLFFGVGGQRVENFIGYLFCISCFAYVNN